MVQLLPGCCERIRSTCASSERWATGHMRGGTSSYACCTQSSMLPSGSACMAASTLASRARRCALSLAMALRAPLFGAQGVEPVQRIQVVGHVAVGRVDHRGAAVQDVVAAEEQAIFPQQQAYMVGRVAGCVDDLQGVGDFAIWRLS